jgi:hypothetical protein
MTLPPFIAGAALLFWGWQSGSLLVAAPLALALEVPRWLRLRFALDAADYARVADLCTVFFVGLAVVLAFDRGVALGVIGAFRWLPAVLAPIVLAQRLGEDGRIPLTALFRYMRKLKARQPDLQVPMVETGGVFVVLCVVAAGVGNNAGQSYYAGAVLLAAWALFATRPRHARLAAWAVLFGAGVGIGYAGHTGMAQFQSWIGGLIADWHLQRAAADLSRSMTDIGTLGRLKQRDTIVARVTGAPRDIARERLLHRASYNAYIGTTWIGRRAQLDPRIVGDVHVAAMRDVFDRQREQLLLRVAEHLADLRVHVDEAPAILDVDDADRRERHRRRESLLALAQLLDGDRSLVEMPDLDARDTQHAQELGLGRGYARRVELEHADRRRARLQGDHEGRVPAGAGPALEALRARLADDVADPDGAAHEPARQPVAGLEQRAATAVGCGPVDDVTQHVALLVDAPERPDAPLLRLAHPLQHAAQTRLDAVGLGENTRDHMLELGERRCARLRTHVAGHAAIAFEAFTPVEDRLAAEAHPAHTAGGAIQTM